MGGNITLVGLGAFFANWKEGVVWRKHSFFWPPAFLSNCGQIFVGFS